MNLKELKITPVTLLLISVAIFIGNLTVKIFLFHNQTLYTDEPFTLFFAQQPFSNIIDRLVHDSNPFFHPFLLHIWLKIFGVTAFSGKLLSIIFSSLTATLLFRLFIKRFGLIMPIIASLLFSLSEIQVFYSQEIRAYAMVGLLATLSLYLFFEILFNPQKKHIFLLGLVNMALVMSHYTSFLLPVCEGMGILLFLKTHKKSIRYFIYSQLFALVLFSPWFIYSVIHNIPQAGKSWIPVPNLINIKPLIIKLTTRRMFVTYITSLVIGILFIIRQKENRNFNIKLIILFIILFWLPIALNFTISQKAPIMLSKYLLYTTIPFFLSIGFFFSQIKINHYVNLGFIIAIIAIATYKFKVPEPHDNWHGKLDRFRKEKNENSIVFINAWWQYRPFAYYYDYDSFIDYDNTLKRLSKKNIHAIFTIEQMEKIMKNKKFDNVFLIKNQGVKSSEFISHLKNKGYSISWEITKKPPLIFALKLNNP